MVTQDKQDDEKGQYTITARKLGAILAFVAALAGGLPITINRLDPDARKDPFTGTQGAQLEQRIQSLEQRIQIKHSEFIQTNRELQNSIIEIRNYINEHKQWGENLARDNAQWRGKIEAEHHEFQKKFEYLMPHRGYIDIR